MQNKKTNRRVRCSVALAGVAAVLYGTAAASAETFDWSILAGAEHSDNIRRTSDNEESQTTAIAGAQLRLEAQRPHLTSDINLDAEYRNYLDNAFDDEIVGGLDGTLLFSIVPERFTWILQDNFGQVSSDPRNVDTPDNRQNINYLTTGPDFIIRFGERTKMTLQGRWSDVYYEDSETDNTRYSGQLSLEHAVSPVVSWSLNGVASRVEYKDSPPNSNYDQQAFYLGLDAHGVRTTVTSTLGYSELHDFGETSDGVVANVTVTRRVAARSTLSVQAGTQFSDTADVFRRDQSAGGVRLDSNGAAQSSDPFKSDYVYVTWRTQTDRTTMRLSGDWRKEDHEQQSELDRDSLGANAEISRRLTSRATLDLEAQYWHDDVTGSDTTLDQWDVGATFSYQIARNFSVQARLTHYSGSGSDNVQEYDENRAYLGVSYSGRP